MKNSRREFLKIAGVSTLSLVVPMISCPGWAKDNLAMPAGEFPTAKRWAMAIDASKCPVGCVDCITACRGEHNIPDIGNPRHEVKWIWFENFPAVFPNESHPYLRESQKQLKLPVLCNQCANPPCVRVCPTQATFQRQDGIVMMDYHRCIGCRLCMAACPYGARSMNYRDPKPFIAKLNPDFPTRTKGVVEKCNFCEERLAIGLKPACVAACKHKALVFGDIGNPRSEIRLMLEKSFNLRRRANLGTQPQIYYIV